MKVRFEDIQETIGSYHPEADFDLLRRAYVFSAMAHRGQVRLSGEPYLTHPIEVAYILAGMKLDLTSVVAGLLHDVIEDTLTTRQVIEDYFGAEVANLVEGLSKISRITFTSEEEKQAENFRKMLMAMVDDIRVILVKLADRLHNMRTLDHLSGEKQERIARETLEIYAPLANRLGMGRVKAELEDLSLKYLDPREYDLIFRTLESQRRLNEEYIAEIRATLERKMRESGIPAEITGRVKHLYSIYTKIRAQGIDVERVYDYVAFRIITDTIKSCYAALGIIHGHESWRPVPGRFKDYIAVPKPNLYQSLHTSVMTDRGYPFEVQIRTREMHAVAEHGIAAHWKYKEGRAVDRREEQGFQWLRRLLELKEMKDPKEFLQAVKLDLYPEEVYTFTPRGEVRAFPRGATAVDFAYSVHTEVGHHCSGARLNGRLVPIKTELKNGDVVEILTSPSQKPSRDWLAYVKTTHARHKIRHWLNVQERQGSLEVGRALFEKECRRYKLNLKTLSADGTLERALKEIGSETLEDFQILVGYGKATPLLLLAQILPREALHPGEEAAAAARAARRPAGAGESRVRVSGADDVMVTLARCCKPIHGDPIVGYITLGKGVSVHSARCPNVENLMYDPHRKIDVAWEGEVAAVYEVPIVVHTEDRPGMLANLTSIIADERTNIRNVEARTTEDHKGRISLVLDVQDRAHLERVLEKLRGLEGVHHVERVVGG